MKKVIDTVRRTVFEHLEKINIADNKLEIILALSGGLDSAVLLDVLAEYIQVNQNNNKNREVSLTAIYINHNLQSDGAKWCNFNQNLCNNYNKQKIDINYQYFDINIDKNQQSKLGIEAAARDARYKIFADLVSDNNKILFTAHHLNDQAETFLLSLMRASGPRGLSAMPFIKIFSLGYHMRPLLNITREQLEDYASERNLSWVDDKTNLDTKFDRNFIRHKVIPAIEERWPNFVKNTAKSARYCQEHEDVLNQYLELDLTNCLVELSSVLSSHSLCSRAFTTGAINIIDLNKFKEFDYKKQKLLLRYWFNKYTKIKSLGEKYLTEIITNCIYSSNDSEARVVIKNFELRKYQNYLYLLDNNKIINKNLKKNEFEYKLGDSLEIQELGLKIKSSYRETDKNKLVDRVNYADSHRHYQLNIPSNSDLVIKFRTNGEKCRPVGRGGSVSVKKLLQENKIPPWLRHKIPILYADNNIASVIGVKNCEPYAVKDSGWVVDCEYLENN